MNQDIENTKEQDVPNATQENSTKVPLKSGVGIIGDTTTNDIVMTKIWLENENDAFQIEINMVGSDFSKCRAKKLEKHLTNRTLDDLKLVLDYDFYKSKHGDSYPIDVLYESIIRAIDGLDRPKSEDIPMSSYSREPLDFNPNLDSDLNQKQDVDEYS